MTSRKIKQSRPAGRKRKAAGTTLARKSYIPTRIPREMVSQVCALTDPFCKHAFGGKYPDDSPTRTVPYAKHYTATVTTNSEGNGCVVVLPNYLYRSSTTGPMLGTTVDLTTSTFSAASVPLASANGVRLVSMGVRVRNIAAPLSAAGMVHLRTYPNSNSSGFGIIDVAAYNGRQTLDVPLQDCKNVVVLPPHGYQPPELFYTVSTISPTTSVIDWVSPGYLPATIAVIGGPASTPVLQLEFVEHWEMYFGDDSEAGFLATPPPPANALVTNAAARVTSSVGNLFIEGVEAFGRRVVQSAATALGAAVSSRLGLGPTPGMTIAARIVD